MDKKRFEKWVRPEIRHGVPTKWNWVVQYPENLMLGTHTDIGAFTYINAKHGVEIHDRVQLGSHCAVYSWSTIDDKKGRVVIKVNARVGSHSIVMPGVTIGINSVIGAFSFVNKNIPNNIVAFGIPVRVIRKLEGG